MIGCKVGIEDLKLAHRKVGVYMNMPALYMENVAIQKRLLNMQKVSIFSTH